MKQRFLKIICAGVVTLGMLCGPALAQRSKNQAPAQPEARKPVIEYIVLVVLLALPFGLLCRSSRRM